MLVVIEAQVECTKLEPGTMFVVEEEEGQKVGKMLEEREG